MKKNTETMETKGCKDCNNFLKHYYKRSNKFNSLSFGHCLISKRRGAFIDEAHLCEYFEAKTDETEKIKKSLRKIIEEIDESLLMLVQYIED